MIENPITLVDKNVDKHGNRGVAEAFINFLFEKDAQRSFARYGFRPVDAEVAAEFEAKYPTPKFLFDINYLGGWGAVGNTLFGPNGLWSQIVEELAYER